MARAKQPVSINGLEFDALISEDRGFEATVPEYAVESGFSVSDSIIIGAETLSMILFVTNTPVTWYHLHGADQGRVDRVCKQLEEMFYNAEPVTIVTSDRTYTSMAIENMTISKSMEVGYAREIPLSFRKIRVTQVASTTIPDSYGKSGATGSQAGTANTTSAKSGSGSGSGSDSGSGSGSGGGSGESKSSVLYSLAHNVGLI